ncbi:hypothetical protein MD484_g5803, partial [Candolleomyces efflorescens]
MSDPTLDFVDFIGSVPREEAIRRFAHVAAASHYGDFFLNNFEIECTDHHVDLSLSETIQLVILPEGQGEDEGVTTLTLHRDQTVATLKWQCNDLLPVLPSTTGLTFIAQDDELGDIGCFSFLSDDLNGYRAADTPVNERIVREIEQDSDTGLPAIKLAIDVATTPMDVEAAIKEKNIMVAAAFVAVYERTGKVEDIDVAIDAQFNLIDMTPIGHEDLPTYLGTLSSLYRTRYERTRDKKDAKKAIAAQRRAVHFTDQGHPTLASTTGFLGVAYTVYFDATQRRAELDTGIAAFREAIALDPTDVVSRMNLTLALEKRFEAFVRPQDLEEALQICRATLEQVRESDDHTRLPQSLDRLAGLLHCRYKYMGRAEDTEEGISYMREAIALLDEDDPALTPMLCNFGVFLINCHTLGGRLVDLEEAITVTQRAIILAGDTSIDLAKAHNILGIAFLLRYDHTKRVSDVEEAVECGSRSVDSTVPGDPSLPVHLSNFGVFLTNLFSATNALPHLERAISVQEKAIEMTEEGTPSMSFRRGSLAETLHTLFNHTGELADIDRAIDCVRKANDDRLPSRADKTTYLHNLGIFLGERFQLTEETSDLEACLVAHREVIQETPTTSSLLANRLLNLGLFLVTAHEATSDIEHLQEAISCFERAATSRFGPPKKRFANARQWIKLASTIDHPSLITAYDTAINLLAVVGGLEQTIERRHESLSDISNLALDAAAAAFELDRIDKAVEWLEEGRCLVWNQLMDLRGSVEELRAYDKDLAERVFNVSQALDKAGSRKSGGNSSEGLQLSLQQKATSQGESLQHLKLANEWEELLQTVQSIPGFANFLQPTSMASLASKLPEDGPVVIINVHRSRCDAIALMAGSEEPLHIPLDDFSFEMAEQMRRDLQHGLSSVGIRARSVDAEHPLKPESEDLVDRAMKPLPRAQNNPNHTFQTVLGQLWTYVVQPILMNLGFSPSHDPGRIWWCPTGPLSFLPIHAAGIYNPTYNPSVSVSDYAVSSYTPTISSLANSWERSSRAHSSPTGIALISQTNTPGLPSLPSTASEIAFIQAQAQDHGVQTFVLAEEQATTEATIASMEQCSWIHFACHAYQDISNPLDSGFHLHDDLLKLSTIIKGKPGTSQESPAEFAFLSACQTSAGDVTLSEEAVHLAAGMLAAGYSSVVATMWAIPDLYAPMVAKHFYTDIFDRENGSLDGSKTAYALHHAMRSLREQLGDSPYSFLAWVPYVHLGL